MRPATPGDLAPARGLSRRECAPAFLWVAPKEKPPRPVEKKGAWAQNGANAPYLLKIRGSQKETMVVVVRLCVGRGPGLAEFLRFQPRESELRGRAKTERTSVPFRCRWPGAPGQRQRGLLLKALR